MTPPLHVFTFISGLTAAFALLHGLLFAFFPKAKANLYYALFALGMSFFYFGVERSQLAKGTPDAGWWDLYFVTCGVPMIFAGIAFELAAFKEKTPLHVKAMALFGAVIVVLMWTLRDDFPMHWINVLGLLGSLEMFRIVFVAIRRRHRDAWLIGLGFGVMTMVGIYEILVNIGLFPWWTPFALPTGVVALTLSMSAYLSRDVARTNRNLEEQLSEVRRLDALTLAQQEAAHAAELERRLLEQENRRHGEQLEKARELQLSMLPKEGPSTPLAEVAFKMWTAERVGGDYYDFRQTSQGELVLALGDATGHGLDSGLMVAAAKSLFQGGDEIANLSESLGRISRGIKSMGLRRMNVAMQLLKLTEGSASLASAGMPPLLIYRVATGEVDEILIPGPPLGALSAFPYRDQSLDLGAGDMLLMMTDGLPETLNAAGEDLGYDKVREFFREMAQENATVDLEGILDRLYELAEDFATGTPQADDLTLLVVRALAPQQEGATA